jgi:hypothetical protein
MDFPNLPHNSRVYITLLLVRCAQQLRKIFTGSNMVYSRAEHLFILEHHFEWKSFAALCEAFSNAYTSQGLQDNDWLKYFGTRKCLRQETCSTLNSVDTWGVPQRWRNTSDALLQDERVATAISWPRPATLIPAILLKQRVYSNNPRSFEELKHDTEPTVANINVETLCEVREH